jgi:hypothetical protein
MPQRRFPPPWSVEKTDAFIVGDASEQALTYVYFEEEPGGDIWELLDCSFLVCRVADNRDL